MTEQILVKPGEVKHLDIEYPDHDWTVMYVICIIGVLFMITMFLKDK